ncbi:PLC-like phosphodiesterase [Pelagophyceae sp. CCMP2097]|nr:PLC-like phosphodiesterase [Pelagophyceae sp. CCMP2097]
MSQTASMPRWPGDDAGPSLHLALGVFERPRARKMLMIGHRGASAVRPENTLASFALACDVADGFECDIQLLRDETLVVLHDDTLWRTATWPRRPWLEALWLSIRPVSGLDAADVSGADVGAWFPGGKFAGTPLPSFDDALDLAAQSHGTYCFTELKESGALNGAMARRAAAAVARQRDVDFDRFFWISFSEDLLVDVRARTPQIKALLVSHAEDEAATFRTAERAHAAGLHGIDVRASDGVTPALTQWLAARGMVCVVWASCAPAANDTAAMWRQMADAGVWAFTSNLANADVERASRFANVNSR